MWLLQLPRHSSITPSCHLTGCDKSTWTIAVARVTLQRWNMHISLRLPEQLTTSEHEWKMKAALSEQGACLTFPLDIFKALPQLECVPRQSAEKLPDNQWLWCDYTGVNVRMMKGVRRLWASTMLRGVRAPAPHHAVKKKMLHDYCSVSLEEDVCKLHIMKITMIMYCLQLRAWFNTEWHLISENNELGFLCNCYKSILSFYTENTEINHLLVNYYPSYIVLIIISVNSSECDLHEEPLPILKMSFWTMWYKNKNNCIC